MARKCRTIVVECMTEAEFVDSIDARFPYGDAQAGRALINQGLGISANAAFAVAYELAHPPVDAEPWTERRLQDLALLRSSLRHPLAVPVLAVVERLIRGEQITVEEAMSLMEQIGAYRDQFAALGLVYMACDDRENVADGVYERIVESWRAA